MRVPNDQVSLFFYRVAIFLLLLSLHNTARTNRAEILRNRELTAAYAAAQERMLLNFMVRTVYRWDKLQEVNPALIVPRVTEPMSKADLTAEEMDRSKPLPPNTLLDSEPLPPIKPQREP